MYDIVKLFDMSIVTIQNDIIQLLNLSPTDHSNSIPSRSLLFFETRWSEATGMPLRFLFFTLSTTYFCRQYDSNFFFFYLIPWFTILILINASAYINAHCKKIICFFLLLLFFKFPSVFRHYCDSFINMMKRGNIFFIFFSVEITASTFLKIVLKIIALKNMQYEVSH